MHRFKFYHDISTLLLFSLQAHFEKLPSHKGLCYNGSYEGQRMLKIQMYFAPDKRGWTFNIGDSPTNNGWGRCACDIYSCTLKNYVVYIVSFIYCIYNRRTNSRFSPNYARIKCNQV